MCLMVRSMGFFPRCWKEVRKELEAVVVAVAGGERVHTYELRKEAVRVALESLQAFLIIAACDLGLPLGVVSGAYGRWGAFSGDLLSAGSSGLPRREAQELGHVRV
ncbi:hypothetical protein EJ110_NYTH46360 [Nymphaea thermarum]|nr:hypothetical protein EJ110_NYTH46360 [Nymphaea thermarum]